jgi:hypothetical protein
MSNTAVKTRARRVDFVNNDADFEVAFLGEAGFSTKFIQKNVNLTPCQIGYRLHKGKIKRTDYRNGESESARYVLKQFRKPLEAITVKHLGNF